VCIGCRGSCRRERQDKGDHQIWFSPKTKRCFPVDTRINAGDPVFDPQAFVPPLDYDQRGAPYGRVTFGQIDMGALELDADSEIVSADFDADTDVDGADFLAWQSGFGLSSGAAKSEGDATGDGAVRGGDLAAWQSTFGDSGASSLRELSVVTNSFAVLWTTELFVQEFQPSVSLSGDNFHVEILWQRYGSRFSVSPEGVANATDFVLTNRAETMQQNMISKPAILSVSLRDHDAGLLEHDLGADEGEGPWKESPWKIGLAVTDAVFARFGLL
jgi:hypothetical protein